MNYKITYTKRFIKNLKRLNAAERAQLKKKLEILEMDPLYPSLRTKRIQGTVDLFEFSVTWTCGSSGSTTVIRSFCCWTLDTMIF